VQARFAGFGLVKALAVAATIFVLASPAKATIVNFNGIAAPGSFSFFGNGPLTLSGATFTSNGTIFVIDPGFYGSSYANGGFLSDDFAGRTDALTVTLPAGIHFVSFDFGALFSGRPVSANVALNGGPATAITAADSINGTHVLDHFSFSSASAISTVTLTLPDSPQFNAIDNFTFLASAVPEPATWVMMLLGFACVGLTAYRRRSRSTFRFA
jgi:hypothetical protein